MYPLLLNVLLQAPPEALLAAIFAHSAIVHKQEVGVEVIQASPLAQEASQRLVGPVDLRNKEPMVTQCALRLLLLLVLHKRS